MISDFLCKQIGYLTLAVKDYEQAKQCDPTIKRYARQWLEYGEAKEEYWSSDKFTRYMYNVNQRSNKIVDFKFPRYAG